MATRFYFPSASAASASGVFAPTPDAQWEATTGFIRRFLELSKNAPVGQIAQKVQAVTINSVAGASDHLTAQYVSAPLDSNQTISGNIKGQVGSSEANLAADMRAQIVVWVAKSDLTSRGTLYAGDTGALANEFSLFGTVTNRKYPRGGSTAVSSVAALTGDRIIVEIGVRKHENATTSRNMIHVLGNPVGGTDLPEDETDTSQSKVPWIEFADNLTFSAETVRESQVVTELLHGGGTSELRESQTVIEILRSATDFVGLPTTASGTGAAYDARAGQAAAAELASGSGAAYDATVQIGAAAPAGVAPGSGAAFNATVLAVTPGGVMVIWID